MSDYDGTRSTIDNNFRCLMKFPVDFPFVNLRTFETISFANEVERLLGHYIQKASSNGKVHKATA